MAVNTEYGKSVQGLLKILELVSISRKIKPGTFNFFFNEKYGYKNGFYKVLVAVDTHEGLVILLGCSHPGMKNMMDAARNLLGKPIYAVLGGTHLVEANDGSLDISMDYLNKGEMKVIGVSHCTGQKAMSNLSISNDRYFHNRTGSSLIVG